MIILIRNSVHTGSLHCFIQELASVQGQASRAEKLLSQHQIEVREAKTSKKIAEARVSRAEERSMVAETQASNV